jgi:N-acetylmuramoyl-L-alanine amidase
VQEFYPKGISRPLLGHSVLSDPLHPPPPILPVKKLIVLHATGGWTETDCYNTFVVSKAPYRVSAHICINQAGTVMQYLPFSDVAWHASGVNSESIGIEHVAIPEKLPASEAQYAASSKLVAWLCQQMGIPCDRAHIKGHSECAPQDEHPLCCWASLDIDRVVSMAQALMGIPT